ncbi:hypothetical protein [Actinomadura sp. WMMA1423]|uniref:hypothetical protein n=1 Tax=Actinomadura sp. WMMA1423 TaxID=2591108 RepID=UPI0011479104|nr:hypothetical protein [Actinomadura sp. WMMA1423]
MNFPSTFLGRPWWQGVSALLAIVGLGLTIIVASCDDQKENRTPKPTIQNNGNNNQNGDNNTLNIQSYAPKIGAIEFPRPRPLAYYVYLDSIESLGSPPEVDATHARDSCSLWEQWLGANPKMFALAPYSNVELVAGSEDVVAIKNILPTIYGEASIPPGSTIITCRYGGAPAGDGFTGYIDTRTNRTEVRAGEGEQKTIWIPDRSLSLSEKGFSYGAFKFRSDSDHAYTGTLAIEESVNGEKRTQSVGDKARPLRWVSSIGRELPKYGWDPQRKKWIHNYVPPNANNLPAD